MPPRYAVHRLDQIPTVPDADVEWHPLQHYFGLNTFGANLFIARDVGDVMVAEHDETDSAQEELYVVLRGSVCFTLDGAKHDASAISVASTFTMREFFCATISPTRLKISRLLIPRMDSSVFGK